MKKIRARKREIDSLKRWGMCVLLSCNSPVELSKIGQGDIVDFVYKDKKGNKNSIRTIAFIVETVAIKKIFSKSILVSKKQSNEITYVVFMELSRHGRRFNIK